jgi:hypothetical protein
MTIPGADIIAIMTLMVLAAIPADLSEAPPAQRAVVASFINSA